MVNHIQKSSVALAVSLEIDNHVSLVLFCPSIAVFRVHGVNTLIRLVCVAKETSFVTYCHFILRLCSLSHSVAVNCLVNHLKSSTFHLANFLLCLYSFSANQHTLNTSLVIPIVRVRLYSEVGVPMSSHN